MSPEGQTIRAGFGNVELLRAFIARHYGDRPPMLVFVAGIPSWEGGGVRYRYSDGSVVISRGGYEWYAYDDGDVPEHGIDPIRP